MMQTEIKVTGQREIQTAFARMLDRAKSPELYLNKVGLLIKAQTMLRFAEGVSPDGAKWLPVLRGGKPLRDTSQLMNSFHHLVSGNSVTVTTPFDWAKVHQFGAVIKAKRAKYLRFKIGNRWVQKKSVRIPARPFFGINENDKKEIVAALYNALIDIGQTSTTKAGK